MNRLIAREVQLSSRWIETCGLVEQLEKALNGPFLKGLNHPRIAFVGRSNVGKSTLINALLEAKLAQTSAEPGKTRLIHFYLSEKLHRILVDLPGYGFAKVSQADRDRWAEFINAYLKMDEGLDRALVLIDSRNGPTAIDKQAIEFLSFANIPVNFVCTKFDKLKTQAERVKRQREVEAAIKDMGFEKDKIFWTTGTDTRTLKELKAELLRKDK